jgi:sigma-B regulation protein RsbU (phosphoserine phosphatase)
MTTARLLLDLVNSRRDPVARMAAAWLGAGAQAFALADSGGLLAWWPNSSPPPQSGALVAPVSINGRPVGELRVFGVNGDHSQARLKADALLLSQIGSMETELNEMTGELIDNQDQLLALYDLTQSMRSQLEVVDVLHTLAQSAGRLLKATAAAAVLIERDSPLLIHYPQPFLDDQTLLNLLAQCRISGNHLLLNAGDPVNPLPTGTAGAIFEPLYVRGQIKAGLCLLRDTPFGSPDHKLARAICDQGAAAIETALLYQETLAQARLQTEAELAKNVQLRLLPQTLPHVNGLDMAAASLPASVVGGDFYDCQQHPGEPFMFAVGDVTGKGMPAALLMAMTRTLLRSKTRSLHKASPADILGSVNDDMYDDFSEVSMFATVFVGQYASHENLLYYANAGHSPVIYCPAGGEAVLLQADGTALGVLPLNLCENHALYFYPGDVLVAATDGFSEARNLAGELFGYDRLLRLVESLATQSAQSIANTLFQTMLDYSAGHGQDDDQTLVVIKGV